MKNARALVVVFGLALSCIPALTQPATGTYPYGSFTGGPDAINLGNLNAKLTIPIVNKAGRGQNFVYDLTYDSSVWYPVGSTGSQSWQPVTTSWWGWQGLSAPAFGGTVTYSVSTSSGHCGQYGQNSWQQWTYSNIVYTDSVGTSHYWNGTVGNYISSTGSMCPPTGASPSGLTVAGTNDGSGYSAEWQISSSGIAIQMLTRTGNTINPGASSGVISMDRNGNEITLSGGTFTDTLGQTALTLSSTSSSTTLSNGNPSGIPYTVNYTSYNIKTNFGCSGISEYSASNVNLVNQVSLPDGRSYSFTYENTPGYSGYKTGRVASVTLPTGGTISYSYTGGSNGIVCADGSTAGLTRTTPDGTWTYARSGSGTQWSTTVTAPTYNSVQNQTVSNFLTTGLATPSPYFYEIEKQVYAGSASPGNLLETLLTCYETNKSNCSSSIGDSGTTVSALSSIMKTTQLPGSSGTISSGTQDLLDAYGNNTLHVINDFASGASFGNVLQQTSTIYTTSYGGDYPTEVTVFDAGSNVVSDTKYAYGTSVVATSGTPNHSSGYNLGNLTSVQKLVSGQTNYLTASYTYYDTGNVYVATDVNTATTTYTYGSGTSCGNSFPTSVSSQTGGSVVTSLTTASTWNCVGGVQLTSVNPNGNTTTYSYGSDPFWRTVSVTKNATGAVTSYAYQTASSNTSSVSMNFNGTSSTNTVVTTYDSQGRPLLTQAQQAPGSLNYDTVAIAYDSIGRMAKQTLSYSGTLGYYVSTNPGTSTTYDAVSRKAQVADSGSGTKTYTYSQNDVLVAIGPAASGENLKKRNLEYNGAGWLISVCELVVSTLPAGGACGQTNSGTNNGYLTKYTYDGAGRLTQVKQNAQSSSFQTRTVAYDDLGRRTSDTIPEWSAGTGYAGTTNYYYDSASGCSGTSAGDLIKKVDPIGNITCFTYDLLHRLTSSQVVSGSYASVTPLTYAVYDAATYGSTAMQNAKGQVAEAYTCSTSACSTKLTDAFFSASPVTSGSMAGGVLSQMWESTPHSGGYFLTQDTYFPNGSVGAISATLGGSSIGIPSLSYGVDGEGRLYSATDSTHSINLVTATAYNPASSPTSITYGNASTGSGNDVDSFTYDSNTLRATNLTYAINPNSSPYTVTTGLTWNANWSLQQMAYVDGNDSTKNQTCSYSADDLSRIASVNCIGAWAQTFSYDPFGNIYKNGTGGSTSYTAAYSPVTNQVSSGITPSPTYDGNGNQTSTSTSINLTWNALNLPISVNSTTATYDVRGRMVEKGVGSTYTQFVYRPSGAMLAVYSGSLTKGTIPLPGGSTAVYNASGLNYIRHKDWLGSSRLATTWAHAVYSKEAYAPFGETYNEAGTPDRSFTGQDQNVATGSGGSGEYDFLFRKYDPSAGRWLSPDPAGWSSVTQEYPQSLNRYAYVQNDPLSLTDPNGTECVWDDGSFDSQSDPDTGSVGQCQAKGGTWIELGQNGNWSSEPQTILMLAVIYIQGMAANEMGSAIAIQGLDGGPYVTQYNSAGQVSQTGFLGWVTTYNADSSIAEMSYQPASIMGAFDQIVQSQVDPYDQMLQQFSEQLIFDTEHPLGNDLHSSMCGYAGFMGESLIGTTGIASAGYQSVAAAKAANVALVASGVLTSYSYFGCS